MHALVTGGSGFIGGHVVKTLLREGVDVRVLVRHTSDTSTFKELDVEVVCGDLTDQASVREAVQSVDLLFHVAADYRLWVPDPERMHAINVDGTVQILRAASEAGVSRIIYTSSVVTVRGSKDPLGTEADFLVLEECRSTYQRTKVLAEQAVWDLIATGMPITIVNPSTPIGAEDRRPTPTGRLIVDYLTGRLPAFLDTDLNWVSVEDVAMGHWLAVKEGRVGERYILGHANLSLGEFFRILADVSGQPAPKVRIPYAVAWMAALVGNVYGRITGREPQAAPDGVRMTRLPMQYDSMKAIKQLGFPQTPIPAAAAEAVEWFRKNGYANT
ncbi:MAG: hopanoid-associated sugar epimerase [Nitrospirota bacterium]|nr:hopanoid-associated sugar epimerase [Nitrospirota bacterium]